MAKRNTEPPTAEPTIDIQAKKPEKFTLFFKLSIVLGIISFVLYANTLKNDFALDDYLAIKDNVIVNKGISAIPQILTTSYHAGFHASNDLYRPLSLIVFATVKDICGVTPAAFHFVNVLVFACCVIALFLFHHRLFERKKIVVAFIASLLFAAHPVHTEVVANCKSLDELLCFFLAFASLNAFLNYTERGKIIHLVSGALLFLLSFLAKETVVTFLAIVPIVFFLFRNENKKRNVYIIIGIVAVTAIALCMRYAVLSSSPGPTAGIDFLDNPLAQNGLALESRLATAILILGYYIKLLIIPYPLICDYSYNSIPFTHFSDLYVLLSLAAYILLIVACIRFFRSDRKSIYGFAILFYLVTISLFSNIIFLIGSNMAERFLFFPSVGFCIMIALLLDKWVLKSQGSDIKSILRPASLGVLAPILLLYTIATTQRNSEWKDNLTLFSADIKKSPENARLSFFLGNEMTLNNMETSNAAMFIEGMSNMKKATEIYPAYEDAYMELGRAYLQAANYEKAEMYEKMALQYNPGNLKAKNYLGSIYLPQKKYTEAIDLYNQVIAIDPRNIDALFNIGACYANIKDYNNAIAALNKVIAINPKYEQYRSYEYLARIYNKAGKPDSAAIYEMQLKKYKG